MVSHLLGQHTDYPERYAPELLFAVPRADNRQALGVTGTALPFTGWDVWTAYEISWLDLQGKPQVRIGELRVAADSLNLVESKSLKLYFNSLNNERFADQQTVVDTVQRDLQACVQGAVALQFWSVDNFPQADSPLSGDCVDHIAVACDGYQPDASLLKTVGSTVSERLYSHLLKTNCPVTGQPDWATLWLDYRGPVIDRASLLRYLVSFRNHQDFHEHCVERITMDLLNACQPEALAVYARYTRRGGLDINPFRVVGELLEVPQFRTQRQ